MKYVKQYTDGQMIFADYMKSLKLCKQNEKIAQQLSHTSKYNPIVLSIENEVYHIWKREVLIRKYTGLYSVFFHAVFVFFLFTFRNSGLKYTIIIDAMAIASQLHVGDLTKSR